MFGMTPESSLSIAWAKQQSSFISSQTFSNLICMVDGLTVRVFADSDLDPSILEIKEQDY